MFIIVPYRLFEIKFAYKQCNYYYIMIIVKNTLQNFILLRNFFVYIKVILLRIRILLTQVNTIKKNYIRCVFSKLFVKIFYFELLCFVIASNFMYLIRNSLIKQIAFSFHFKLINNLLCKIT